MGKCKSELCQPSDQKPVRAEPFQKKYFVCGWLAKFEEVWAPHTIQNLLFTTPFDLTFGKPLKSKLIVSSVTFYGGGAQF